MTNEIITSVSNGILNFLSSSIIPSAIAVVGVGYFATYYYKANRIVNKHRKKVQQDLINKATIVFPRREYDVACAGSNDHSSCEKVETIDIEACNFCDKNGKLLNVSQYECFVVHGNSMKYAGINDRDFLFVPKGFELSSLTNESLPQILVIRYRENIENRAKFKVRRTWYKGTIDEKLEEVASNIIDSKAFSKLTQEKGYQGKDWMLNDLKIKRIARYKDAYFKDGNCPTEYKEIIISTTYDTEDEEIHFSIHPASSIIGIVSESYTVINK